MNSLKQPIDNELTNKPSSDQGKDTSNSKAFRPVLGALRVEQESEKSRKRAKQIKKARQKAQTEFKAWKRMLCNLINKESQVEFNKETLTWQFVVPARLNRFFYEVMIKEYVRAKKAANKDDAATMIRQKFDTAADAAISAEKILLEQQKGASELKAR